MRLQENLDVFLGDFGVPCSKGPVTFTGLFDMPDETLSLAGVNVLSTMYQLTLRTDDAQRVALASGDALVVNGLAYTVRDVFLTDDGAFSKASLSK